MEAKIKKNEDTSENKGIKKTYKSKLPRIAGILIHTDLGHTENLNKKRQVSTLPEESVYSRPVFLHRGHSLTCWQDFEQFCNFGDV